MRSMAILPILIAPDARLKTVSKPVDTVDDGLRALMDDMLETMYAAPGVGLAAIQVNVPKRVIVMDVAREGEAPSPRFFINPEIIWQSEEQAVFSEGCLSFPEMFDDVERPARIRLRYLDYAGKAREEAADGLFAVCIQHEMDHLEGVLFVDHLSRLKRDAILRKLQKARRLAANA
ncbi:MAG: peptide deformylase [Alphaproteobacteria bacterium]|nr:peptide deformylase [Alphaproteobacteria bacterium]